MSETLTEADERLDHALGVILARVRCGIIHQQSNNGRCVLCISWAKNIGVPRHRDQMKRALASGSAGDATGGRA